MQGHFSETLLKPDSEEDITRLDVFFQALEDFGSDITKRGGKFQVNFNVSIQEVPEDTNACELKQVTEG